MNNKKYFKDMNNEEKIKLLDISDFYDIIYEKVYEDNMYTQQEEFNLMEIEKYVDIKDCYNSFYLVLKEDAAIFIKNIDDAYFNPENIKQYAICKEILQKYENSKREKTKEKYYDILENQVNKLIEGITEQLREYEIVNDADLEYYIIDEMCEDIFSNYFIINNDFTKLYYESLNILK